MATASCGIGNTTPHNHVTKERPQTADNDIRNVKIFPFWLHYANIHVPKKQLGFNALCNIKDSAIPPA